MILAVLGSSPTIDSDSLFDQCLQNNITACDNCLRRHQFKEVDVTDQCKKIVEAVKKYCSEDRYTVLMMVELFKGAQNKRNKKFVNTSYHGYLKPWDRNDVERLFHRLILDGYLKEEIIISYKIPPSYLRLGYNTFFDQKIIFQQSNAKKKIIKSNMKPGSLWKYLYHPPSK